MNFKMTKIAALAAMAFATTGAHAALDMSGNATLSIQNDAVTEFTGVSWTVTSNGPMADSFFTMGGSVKKLAVDTQFAYINGTSNVINLNGSVESTVGTFTYYGNAGSNDTGSFGGMSVLSASGDTATIDMSNWKVDWNNVLDIPMGSGAWNVGTVIYSNGVGQLTCTAGSGCAKDSEYTLKYTATVPAGDPSGFGDVKYYVELHGVVGAVPEASTYGMMLAGLGLVGFAVRRRKQVI